VRLWLWLAAALVLRPVAAQELKLEELVAQVQEGNPEILVAQKKYEAARQRPSQVASLPDPMISPGWNSNGSPVPWAGLGRDPTSNIGFSITQEIPYPGKQRLRANVARKEADALFAEFESVQLNVLSRLKQAYFRLQHYYAARDVLEQNRKVLQSLLTITEVRYSAGKAAQQDVFKAQLQISLIDTKILQLDRERHLREAEINSLLNLPSNTPLPKPGEPHVGPLSETLPDLQTAARDRSPMRVRDQKMAERAETALNLARKDYYPDYAISGGYYNMAGLPAFYSFRADIRIPLYFRSKQRAEVTEQAIAVSQAKHAYEATGLALDLRIADDYTQADTAYQLVEAYRTTILPQAQLTVESSLASYQTGGVDFMSVLNNQTASLEYEMDSHEQMLNYHLAIVRLEEVTGMDLMGGGH
jgi:cobalt-zinc-cadmium efflux system outer membrane protein